ncbi:MAG: S8 family serine peptidase [Anaerolineae bacterium]
MRHCIRLVALALVTLCVLATGAEAQVSASLLRDANAPRAKIAPELLQQLTAAEAAATVSGAEPVTFLVHLSESATLDDLLGVADTTARRERVADRLQATATRSQARVVAALQRAILRGNVSDYRSYWIINGLAVDGDLATALELASLPEVESIQPNRTHHLPELPETPARSTAAGTAGWAPPWGIQKISADRVWSELGITGEGVVVANLDTGVDWTHPALQRSYRGYQAADPSASTHDYNWFDATGTYPSVPGPTACGSSHNCMHGTHTMGTLVGATADGSEQIGVAPGARRIAVKVFDDYGDTTDAMILDGLEWCLAPKDLAGSNPDPALAPDIISNSWGSSDGSDTVFVKAVDNLRAAGILVVFAAGNSGSMPATINAPGSYTHTLSVGATASTDEIAYFSSRGPSPWGAIKPEVVAPGVSVRSSVPGGGYDDNWSGTSMATPHVAGLAALLWEANRAARPEVSRTLSVTATEYLITRTTVDLGTPGPDNAYGWGRIDVYAAVERVLLGDLSTSSARFDTASLRPGQATTLRFSLVKIGGAETTGTLTCTIPAPLVAVTDSLYASAGVARIEDNHLTWEGPISAESSVLVELSVWSPPETGWQDVSLHAYLTDAYGNTPRLETSLRIVPYLLWLPLARQTAP